jgi:hypothetical protein
VGDAALQQSKRQRADSGTDVEQRSVQRACAGDVLLKQARCRSSAQASVALQFLGGFLFIEVLFRRAFKGGATR